MPQAAAEARAGGARAAVRARLFGLDLASRFPIVGVPSEGEAQRFRERPLRLELAHRRALLDAWQSRGAERLADRRDASGRRIHLIEHHPEYGTIMRAVGCGTYVIDAPATAVRCSPVRSLAPWLAQRYLIGQVLPFVAALRGLEVWHASAVAIRGGAVAIVAPSRGGKSTLAAQLMKRGATLVTDDVLALETDLPPRGLGSGESDARTARVRASPVREIRVQPGPGLLSLRRDRDGRLDRPPGARAVGASADAVRLGVPRHHGPLPLRAVVFLRRLAGSGRLLVERDPAPPPRLLLGATFNLVLRGPQRLLGMLDLCAAIARSVPVLHLTVPAGARPEAAAEALERALP